MEKLDYARKAATFIEILKKETKLIAKVSDDDDHIVYIETENETQQLKKRLFRKGIFSTEKETWRIGYLNNSRKCLTVFSREHYDELKKAAEQCPWIEIIEKEWDFELDEPIETESERVHKKTRKKTTKVEVTEETIDVTKPRYETIGAERMKEKLILKYPDVRSIYKHPENEKEFLALMDRMLECRKIDDIDGVFTCAMQLIPTVPVKK